MSEQVKEVTVELFCGQCKSDKFIPKTSGCISYPRTGQERWLRLGACPLGNVDLNAPEETRKQKINPLKASKRAKKGK